MRGPSGRPRRVTVVQIAGVVARRIVCRVGSGDKPSAGERFGMIRFGSRTDLLHAARRRGAGRVGERVRAGETVMGCSMNGAALGDGSWAARRQAVRGGGAGRSCGSARQGIFLFPSLLTTGNLFCGFFALLLAVEQRYIEAALAILVAMVMDLLDGRVARLMKATSQFGVEFDSLADVISFCVAPAFLFYSFALRPLGRAAWFGAFLFVICGALRLARFNVQTGVVDRRLHRPVHPGRRGMAAPVISCGARSRPGAVRGSPSP